MYWKKKLKDLSKHWVIICIPVLAVAIRTIMFFVFDSASPFGYDVGFYRRYLIEPVYFFQSVPGLGPNSMLVKIVLDILKLTHLNADIILAGSLILLGGAVALMMYYLVRKYAGHRIGLYAGFLFAISPIQYFTYWCMLYKNAWGLLLMICAMWAIEKRSRLMYVFPVLLAFSHQTTSIIFVITLVVFGVINKERREETIRICFLMGVALLLTQTRGVGDALVHIPQASFNSWFQYIPANRFGRVWFQKMDQKLPEKYYDGICHHRYRISTASLAILSEDFCFYRHGDGHTRSIRTDGALGKEKNPGQSGGSASPCRLTLYPRQQNLQTPSGDVQQRDTIFETDRYDDTKCQLYPDDEQSRAVGRGVEP